MNGFDLDALLICLRVEVPHLFPAVASADTNAWSVEGSDGDDRYRSERFASEEVIFLSVVSFIGGDYLDRLSCRPELFQDFDEVERVVPRPVSDFDGCDELPSCFDCDGLLEIAPDEASIARTSALPCSQFDCSSVVVAGRS